MGLLPFQVECLNKLVDQPTCIIGDDMGLGKTVEAIAMDKARRETSPLPSKHKHTLVICPMSVMSSWETHYAEWMPELTVRVLDRKNREAFERDVEAGSYDVYIMHWDVIRLMPDLARYNWFHIIADEAHRASNREAQVTQRVKKLKHRWLTLLTGTPMTTRPEQFWSLLNWLKPKIFTSYHRFFAHHVIFQQHTAAEFCPICYKQHKSPFKVITGVAHIDQLQAEIKPYYVRRLKEDVLKDLPEKTYSRITVDLDPKQRRVYEQMRQEMIAWIGEHEDEPLAASMAIAKLVRLQQLACAYAEFVKVKVRKANPAWADQQAIIKELDDTEIDSYLNMTERQAYLELHGTEPQYKEVIEDRVRLIDPSSKLDAVMELIGDNPEKQFVVFSQSKQVINLFAKRLEAAKVSHGILTGDTQQADRGQLVEAFQRGQIKIFAGTIQAGGVGITLTAASTVVFLDRAWSPAVNRQAEDRLHRMGQKNAVQVIDIVAKNTIDAGRLQKIEHNWQFIKALLGDKDAITHPEGTYI